MYCYKLIVAYDGTNYCGWQVQINDATIQGVMMQAAVDLFGAEVTLTGASRTDSGVHANGQVVLLVAKKWIDPYKVPLALNRRLPKDIVVRHAKKVEDTFHPRYCDHRKTYIYKVYNGPHHLPCDQKYSMHYRYSLDIDPIKEAATYFVGTHDFESFSSIKKSVENTVRTLYNVEVKKEGDMVYFKIIGNGFLYNMVRIIVGTLLEVGAGRREVDSIKHSLLKRDRNLAGKTALAKGLTLELIEYKDEM